MPMAFKIRSSKFRHVFGNPFRKEDCYENVRITRNAHDSNFCAVNPKYLAVVTESAGGGTFIVLPLERTGRIDVNAPKVSGHKGAVLDIKWNPFNDNIIASASEDCSVKVWQIPKDGIITTLSDWSVDLHGHSRRIGYLEWHPTAENIVLSAGFDLKCIVWNVEQAEPVNIVNSHQDTIFSIAWNRDGSLFATTSKDKKLRVIDPRTCAVAVETLSHNGPKASKVVFTDNHRLATSGFSQTSSRQLLLWDIRNCQNALYTTDLDASCGIILPYYDYDTRVIYLAGKGDGNIRYFEVSDTEDRFHFLNLYQSSLPQRGLGVMPKRGCDVRKCEIMRFYKLHASKNLVEPISMIVPRKTDTFQEDVYPPTASYIASLRADEWVSGQNREPILVSVQDGHITNTPKISTSKAVQKQDCALQQAPMITTYKAINRHGEPPVQMRHTNTGVPATYTPLGQSHAAAVSHSHTAPPVNQSHAASFGQSQNKYSAAAEPASIKNIKRLSFNEEFVTVSTDSSGKKSAHSTHDAVPVSPSPHSAASPSQHFAASSSPHFTASPSKIVPKKVYSPGTPTSLEPSSNGLPSESEHELHPSKSLPRTTLQPSKISTWREAPSTKTKSYTDSSLVGDGSKRRGALNRAKTISSPSEHSNYIKLVIGEPTVQSHTNKIHIRKAWHAPQPTLQPHSEMEAVNIQGDPELKKAYFRQVEEINSLKEQVSLKDKRIRQLEMELTKLKEREKSLEPGQSNC